MAFPTDGLHKFFRSTRTYIFFTSLISGAVAFQILDQQQADAIIKAAVELGIAFFGSTWTHSVGQRDVGQR
jgi:16S rRNA U1498 N3-methylase RsmE